jgi:hypothetical protein
MFGWNERLNEIMILSFFQFHVLELEIFHFAVGTSMVNREWNFGPLRS